MKPITEEQLSRDWLTYMSAAKKREIEVFLAEHFGERCLDYFEGCICCDTFKALDDLFRNPYED